TIHQSHSVKSAASGWSRHGEGKSLIISRQMKKLREEEPIICPEGGGTMKNRVASEARRGNVANK
ncbi:uncharacterized, partial [Tachysurus ichikawai]